jgi:hypothetical protein
VAGGGNTGRALKAYKAEFIQVALDMQVRRPEV